METNLEVKGMHCQGCERTITNALMKVKGVKSARVSYPSERAAIEHDDGLTSKSVIKAIEDAGYEARVADGAAPRKRFLGLF